MSAIQVYCLGGFLQLKFRALGFSVGSVLILSLIVGGTLAQNWNVGPVGLLLLVLAVGLACGLVSDFFMCC